MNKVIAFSNQNLASCDRESIIIWKQNKKEENKKIDQFYFFKEIKTNYDTCQLLEINNNVFACAIYQLKQIIIFLNDEKDYPILNTIDNVERHGYNSNAMAKINEKFFCSGGGLDLDLLFYIICIEPCQVVKKIKLNDPNPKSFITCLHMNEKGFLFVSCGEKIIQYKVNIDNNNNIVELKEVLCISDKNMESRDIVTTKDGKIFYQIKDNYTLKFHLIPFLQNE